MDGEYVRTRRAYRLLAILLLLASCLPFARVAQRVIWPWQGLLDAGWSDGLALALPALGAVLFGWAGAPRRRQATAAAVILSGFFFGWILARVVPNGSHPLPVFEQLTDGLPSFFSRGFFLVLAGLALMAAALRVLWLSAHMATDLGRRPAAPWMSRALGLSAAGLIGLFFLLPHRGFMPLADLPLVLGPAVLAGVGLWHLFSVRGRPGRIAWLTVLFLPLLSLMVAVRDVGESPGLALVHLRSACLLAVLSIGLGLAIPALVRQAGPELFGTAGRFWSVRGGMGRVGLPVLASLLASMAVAILVVRPTITSELICPPSPADPSLLAMFSRDVPGVLDAARCRAGEPARDWERMAGALQSRCPEAADDWRALRPLCCAGRLRLHRTRRMRDRFNRHLQACGLPFFVVSRLRSGDGPARQALTAYRVRDCRTYRNASAHFVASVLQLTRLGEPEPDDNHLGMTEQEGGATVVFVDRIQQLLDFHLPGLLAREDAIGRLAAAGAQVLASEGRLADGLREGLTRHELHHRFMGLEPEPPGPIRSWSPRLSEAAAREVTAEAGAILAELATAPAYGRLRMALILQALESEAGNLGDYGIVRRFIVARLLEGAKRDPGRVGDDALMKQARALLGLTDVAFTRRVQNLHWTLFGQFVPQFVPVLDPEASRPADRR